MAEPQLWQNAVIEKIAPQTPRVRSFFLRLAEPFAYEAGQHVDIRVTGSDGEQAQRRYSIASAPESGGIIELCIEELEGGAVSSFFQDAAPGKEIQLRGPLGGQFVWTAEQSGPVLLIGGGSGVVPLMSMARHRAAAGSCVPMALLYSARSWDEVIFREELLGLHGRRDGFDFVMTLTRDVEKRGGLHARRVDSAMVLQAMENFPALVRRVYVCGSNAFVEAASAAAIGAGVAAEAIRTERYGG